MPELRKTAPVFACLAVALTLMVVVLSLDGIPPYYDYDSCITAVFVNNSAAGRAHDHFFSSLDPNLWNPYHGNWATQWIPLSTPLGWVAEALDLAPRHTLSYLKVVGLVITVLGLAVVFAIYRRILKFSFWESVLGVCLCLGSPMLFLFALTAVVQIMLSWSLSLMVAAGICFYVASENKKWLYLTAIPAAGLLLFPYPTAFVLPLFAIVYLFMTGKLKIALANKHTYVSLVLTLSVAYSLNSLFLFFQDVSWSEYLSDSNAFYQARRGASLPIVEAVSQRASFFWRSFLLGESSHAMTLDGRSESIWFLGTTHIPWLVFMVIATVGALWVRRKDSNGPRIAETLWTTWRRYPFEVAMVVSHIVVFAFFSHVAGRYLLLLPVIIVPIGIRALRRFMAHESKRMALISVLVIAVVLTSYGIARTSYRERMRLIYRDSVGITEAMDEILQYSRRSNVPVIFCPSDNSLPAHALMMVLGDFKICSPMPYMADYLSGKAPPNVETLDSFIMVWADDTERMELLRKQGWSRFCSIVDGELGAELELLHKTIRNPSRY